MDWTARGRELSELMLEGRRAYLEIDEINHGQPAPGSVIQADWRTLSHLDSQPWPESVRSLASFTARSLTVAGGEYLAGLGVLYGGPSELLTRAHYPVLRALVESLAQARWILGPGINQLEEAGDEFARQRAARAYLTLCASESQRRAVTRERSGETSPSYQQVDQQLQRYKADAARYFRPVTLTGDSRGWCIEGQKRPSFTAFTESLMELAFLPDAQGTIKNPYAFLSGTSHTNLFSVFDLSTTEEHDGHNRFVFEFQADDAETLASFACQIFSIGTEVITASHDWDDQALVVWHDQVRAAFVDQTP
jgi:hypothetical protein